MLRCGIHASPSRFFYPWELGLGRTPASSSCPQTSPFEPPVDPSRSLSSNPIELLDSFAVRSHTYAAAAAVAVAAAAAAAVAAAAAAAAAAAVAAAAAAAACKVVCACLLACLRFSSDT
ncbi:hypothetical protein B296_00055159 [Ensete ventricosum]|uniref:Uncharacterized protein n=1 Tax=Ensete ventricosum TaxID=4639 RepID=A0A426XBE6_ENSVE|nr:hypothetical protein B296_00055159 [Ensete ventricosum]